MLVSIGHKLHHSRKNANSCVLLIENEEEFVDGYLMNYVNLEIACMVHTIDSLIIANNICHD